MSSLKSQEIWKEFFQVYKNLPELWNTSHEGYKNRGKRLQAMNKLLRKYHEIDPYADLNDLKSKIQSLRSCYRREYRKIKDSIDNATSESDIYVPQLWYFEWLDFLRQEPGDDDPLTASIAVNENSDDSNSSIVSPPPVKRYKPGVSDCSRNFNEKDIGELHVSETSTPVETKYRPSSNVNRSSEILKKTDTLLQEISKNIENNNDEASVFGKSWACSYRKLNETQKIYAKKAIEDILVLGQLDQLSFNVIQDLNMSFDNNKDFFKI